MADNRTPDQRWKTIQAIKGSDTSLEETVSSSLHKSRMRYRRCVTNLPRTPDFDFTWVKVAVFVDGDFRHGWRFPD